MAKISSLRVWVGPVSKCSATTRFERTVSVHPRNSRLEGVTDPSHSKLVFFVDVDMLIIMVSSIR